MKYGLVHSHNQNPGQCSEVAIQGISHYQRLMTSLQNHPNFNLALIELKKKTTKKRML